MKTELYTIKEIILKLNISRTTLYKLWDTGVGPKRINVGRRVYVTRASLDRWIGVVDAT